VIKIANIAIIDTGYLNITDTGTQASTLANSGSAINLKSVTVTFQRKANINQTEIINTNSGPVIGFGSVSAGKITIKGVLDSNTDADMTLMIALNDLLHTYGVKLLYYTSTTDGYRDITDSLGDANKNDTHKADFFSDVAIPHLHLKFTNFQITRTAKSYLYYTLEGFITN